MRKGSLDGRDDWLEMDKRIKENGVYSLSTGFIGYLRAMGVRLIGYGGSCLDVMAGQRSTGRHPSIVITEMPVVPLMQAPFENPVCSEPKATCQYLK